MSTAAILGLAALAVLVAGGIAVGVITGRRRPPGGRSDRFMR